MIEPGRHHVSKSYIPLTVFRTLWIVIAAVIVGILNLLKNAGNILEYAQAVKMLPILAIAGAVLLLGLIAFFSWISYKRLTWEITDEELHIYKGIFVKKKSHIPFRRIHSVDINAKILDRIFGVVTVKLDTAAGSAKSEDARIPALHLSTAELLRTEIFNRKNMAENPAMETVSGGGNVLTGLGKGNDQIRGIYAGESMNMTAEAEYRLSNKELILYCASNGKAFAIIFAILLFVNQLVDIFSIFNSGAEKVAADTVSKVTSMGPIIVIALAILALIISIVISFITRALTYGNFVVSRFGGRVEVSTGLIQKKSTGVAVERIQTLKIKQGLLQRILGYVEVSLETASGLGKSGGNDQDTNPGVILHPFLKKDKLDDFMDKMLNEFADIPDDLKPLSGLAMRRSIIRYGMWTAILIILPVNLVWHWLSVNGFESNLPANIITWINEGVIGVSTGLFVLMLVLGWAVWKGRAYGRNTKYVAMRKGIIGRSKIFVHKKKIQYAQVAQNPFQKRVGLVTIKANTAALGSSNESLKDIELIIADEYLDWIENKKGRSQEA